MSTTLGKQQDKKKRFRFAMFLVTIGIVYGDIGTSPLYVMKSIMEGNGGISGVDEQFIIGSLSLVIWTITLLTTVKYVLIAMKADNHGEGGIFSLYALVKSCGKWLIVPAMLGGAALLADGVLTPAVTVTTAVEGLRSIESMNRFLGSGQLKVAPEHVSENVLRMLGKPPHSVYTQFARRYNQMNQSCGMNQYLVPYLISSHPGCTMKDAVELAEYLRDIHHQPEQVQDFYPTPSTLSTVMYYTGVDPRTLKYRDASGRKHSDPDPASSKRADLSSMKKVYVPRDPHEKAMQRACYEFFRAEIESQLAFPFRNPKLRPLVEEALRRAHREDLIGYGPKCLIRPERGESGARSSRGRRKAYSKKGKEK